MLLNETHIFPFDVSMTSQLLHFHHSDFNVKVHKNLHEILVNVNDTAKITTVANSRIPTVANKLTPDNEVDNH